MPGPGRTPKRLSPTISAPLSMRPGTVFIGGVPMNWATNRFAGVSYTSRGVPTCWRRPAAMTAMRVAIVMASTWSWVTYTTVTPKRRWRSTSSALVAARSLASRFDSGSSIRNTCGRDTTARASATRWRCPPESAAGLRSRYGSRPSIRAASVTRSPRSAFVSFRRSSEPSTVVGFVTSGDSMFLATVMCGYSA